MLPPTVKKGGAGGASIDMHLSDVAFLEPFRDAVRSAGGFRGLAGASREFRKLAWELRDPSRRMLAIVRPGTRLSPECAGAATSAVVREGASLEDACPRCEELTLHDLGGAAAGRTRRNLPALKRVTIVTRPISYSRVVRQLEKTFDGVEQRFVARGGMRRIRPHGAPPIFSKDP